MPLNEDDGPSARDFERLSRVVETLTSTIEALPQRMEATYVRKDVYQIQHEEQKANIGFLTKVLWSVIGFVFTALGSAILAVVLIP